ncbi:MAG TPA: hypothetical protein VGH27_28885 [Streptosporangiaceae bacterium]|jgi:hypothetical protein
MTTPDPRVRVLDPAHVLAVVQEATAGLRGSTARAASKPDAVRIRFMSRRVARDAAGALQRVGYRVSRVDGTDHRHLLVTGWDPAALDTRLATMRTVIHQLEESPAITAAAVIDRVRNLPDRSPVPPDATVLTEAGQQLQAWVSVRSGIHAPHDPVILPADLGTQLRLRLTWVRESAIDDLINHHLKAAGHALSLFDSLRWHMTDDQAQAIAIRRADVTSRLNRPRGDAPAATSADTVRPPGFDLRFSWPDPDARPARLAASGFPCPARPSVPRGAIRRPPTHPGGGNFPASRLGPHRGTH